MRTRPISAWTSTTWRSRQPWRRARSFSFPHPATGHATRPNSSIPQSGKSTACTAPPTESIRRRWTQDTTITAKAASTSTGGSGGGCSAGTNRSGNSPFTVERDEDLLVFHKRKRPARALNSNGLTNLLIARSESRLKDALPDSPASLRRFRKRMGPALRHALARQVSRGDSGERHGAYQKPAAHRPAAADRPAGRRGPVSGAAVPATQR